MESATASITEGKENGMAIALMYSIPAFCLMYLAAKYCFGMQKFWDPGTLVAALLAVPVGIWILSDQERGQDWQVERMLYLVGYLWLTKLIGSWIDSQ